MVERRYQAVDFFSVLARARHLLPEAQTVLDPRALPNPDLMAEAARLCGLTLAWERFDPDDASNLRRLLGAIQGDLYVLGSANTPGLQVIQIPYDELESVQADIDFSFDAALIGVTAPIVGLVHHEGLCSVVSCPPPQGQPEDPRDLERQLLEQLERRRKEALERLPPPEREGLLAILKERKKIAAVKYLRNELGCPLVDAKQIVDSIDPWWPERASAVEDPGFGLPRDRASKPRGSASFKS